MFNSDILHDLACPSPSCFTAIRDRTRTSVLGTPSGDTHITSDMCVCVRGYTYYCDSG